MRRLRRCKIIATLGPASATPAMTRALFDAGADLFRINMSHTTHDQLRAQAEMIRALQEECGRPIGIIIDLQGPKLRVGTFKDRSVTLVKGEKFDFDSNPADGDQRRVWLPHPEVLRALKPGHMVLIDDGKVRLQVIEANDTHAVAITDVGGEISDRKGMSLPDTEIPVSSITEKDRADLEAALEAGIDWVAVSFVQRPDDVAEVKKLISGRALVMSKIEKPLAISRLDEIVEISGALMVARGDLGVEMPLEKVPGLQKRINRLARRLGKPVVVATQMLESMITAPVPAASLSSGAFTRSSPRMPTDDMSRRACKFAGREGFAKSSERVIIVAGVPFGTPGATNMVRISLLDEDSR
jgi:pyruvate kinase